MAIGTRLISYDSDGQATSVADLREIADITPSQVASNNGNDGEPTADEVETARARTRRRLMTEFGKLLDQMLDCNADEVGGLEQVCLVRVVIAE